MKITSTHARIGAKAQTGIVLTRVLPISVFIYNNGIVLMSDKGVSTYPIAKVKIKGVLTNYILEGGGTAQLKDNQTFTLAIPQKAILIKLEDCTVTYD
ncbi:hypothetical protein GCM10027422_07320 [Hymenobacter arcticus]